LQRSIVENKRLKTSKNKWIIFHQPVQRLWLLECVWGLERRCRCPAFSRTRNKRVLRSREIHPPTSNQREKRTTLTTERRRKKRCKWNSCPFCSEMEILIMVMFVYKIFKTIFLYNNVIPMLWVDKNISVNLLFVLQNFYRF
jgi:hypothetical protein